MSAHNKSRDKTNNVRFWGVVASILPLLIGYIATALYPSDWYVRLISCLFLYLGLPAMFVSAGLFYPRDTSQKIAGVDVFTAGQIFCVGLGMLSLFLFSSNIRDSLNVVLGNTTVKSFPGSVLEIGSTGLASIWQRTLKIQLDDGSVKTLDFPFPNIPDLAGRRSLFIVTPNKEIILEIRQID